MGKVMSVMVRKMNRFNVENRAHRFLERDKPQAAPKFESNIRDMQRALELDPNLVENLNKKDAQLGDRLKSVYVTSQDRYVDFSLDKNPPENRHGNLPLNRSAVEDFEYGFKEPVRISPGRCTLRQAMKFITDHQGDPTLWSQGRIAAEYKMKEDVVGKILTYFKSFQMYIPNIKSGKENLLTQANIKMIDGKDDHQPNQRM